MAMKWHPDRDVEIWKMREAGMMLKDIGAHFGITGNRARQIHANMVRQRSNPANHTLSDAEFAAKMRMTPIDPRSKRSAP